MIEFDGNQISFPINLWVQTGGVAIHEEQGRCVVEGVDEESYVKVLNHFGRVLKLYTFEDGHWVDSDTEAEPTAFDDHLAGYVKKASLPQEDVTPADPKGSKPKQASPSQKAAADGKAQDARDRESEEKSPTASNSAAKQPDTERADTERAEPGQTGSSKNSEPRTEQS